MPGSSLFNDFIPELPGVEVYYDGRPSSTKILVTPLEVVPSKIKSLCAWGNSHFNYLNSDNSLSGYHLVSFRVHFYKVADYVSQHYNDSNANYPAVVYSFLQNYEAAVDIAYHRLGLTDL